MIGNRKDLHEQASEKEVRLVEILVEQIPKGMIIAFSGGVDSAYLLFAASLAARKIYFEPENRPPAEPVIYAITTKSPAVPLKDLNDAREFAEDLPFVYHEIIDSSEFQDERYLKNDALRCYYCKTNLFTICKKFAIEKGHAVIAYGFTVSDQTDDRPGHRAASENEILSPLADAGLEKEEIRTLLALHGFDLADKPASPCLSSRLVRGVSVSQDKLEAIAAFESFLKEKGFSIFRARFHETGLENRLIRLELDPKETGRIFEFGDDLKNLAETHSIQNVTVDLFGYRTGGANV